MRYLHQQCGLIPLLHHEPLALLIVQFELRNGLGFGCLLVGCLDIAKVFGAGAKIETRQDRGLECRTGCPPATFMTSYCTSNALFASMRRHCEGSVLRRTQRRAKAEMPILASAIGPV